MSTISWFDRYRVREVWVLGLLAVGIAGASSIVSAAPLVCYVNNHAYPVERSETEFALELLSGDTPAAAAARFEMLGLGSVEALPWGPEDGRFAILRVARADAETRVRARECGLVKSVRRVYRFHADGLPHIGSGRLVVRLAEGIGEDALAALSADYGARLIQAVGGLGGTYVLEPLDPAIDEVELAAHMHQDPRTVYAHPDLISPMIKTQFEWDDEFFSPLKTEPLADLQWHLDNTGQEGGVLGADINIADAFTAGEYGEGVVVGMLDDACDVFHEDLLPNYTNVSHNTRTGAVSDTAANPVSEKERHGTAMMGLICAPLNSKGIAGVAPDARFTVSRGADDGLSASQIADAFDFAMQRGVDVHCNSWADEPGTPVLSVVCNAVEEAFTDGRDGFGMVVVFPTGNDGELFEPSAVLAGLTNNQGHKLVIGVGACNAHERVASYSNYGVGVVDVLAPSGDIFLPQIVTTDNTDENFPSAPGYNIGGVDDFGLENLSDSSYTQGDSFSEVSDRDFFGTSAACAQAAGVAALVMGASSVSEITATQVRAILEHTADQIPIADLEEGDYNGITRRSRKYGYGRVNAGKAVEAASMMTTNNPYAWPERVRNVAVSDFEGGKILRWEKNDDLRITEVPVEGGEEGETEEQAWGDETTGVLVVRRIGLDFEWVPTDGQNYYHGLTVDYEQDVTVVQAGDNLSYEFDDSLGIIYFGIFARNAASRYSFGVSIDSQGNIVEHGHSINTGEADANDNDNTPDIPTPVYPTVSIEVSPLSGRSPLKVSFKGNSPESDSAIESVSWDFGDGSPPVAQAVTEHTYVVSGTQQITFTATLTIVDADGDEGKRSVNIVVLPAEGVEEDPSTGGIRILITEPGGSSLDIGDLGEVGSRIELTVDTTRIVGTPQSVFWNLGDGTTARSFVVSHVYDISGTFPILAEVTALTSSGDTLVFQASRLFTVLGTGTGNDNDNDNDNDNTNDNGSPSSGGGTAASGSVCGVGMLVPMLAMVGLAVLRGSISTLPFFTRRRRARRKE